MKLACQRDICTIIFILVLLTITNQKMDRKRNIIAIYYKAIMRLESCCVRQHTLNHHAK